MLQLFTTGKLQPRVDRCSLCYFNFSEGVTFFKIKRSGKSYIFQNKKVEATYKMVDRHVLMYKEI